MADEAVEVELSADNRSFIRSFNEATKAVQTTASGIGYLKGKFQELEASVVSTAKKIGMMTGAALAASGTYAGFAVKSFASLEEQMMNVSTVADLTQLSLGDMTEAVRRMALEIPKSAEELAVGLYDVNSAGFQGAEGLSVLDASARFAQAGLTDVSTSVRGVTALLNAYGMGAHEAGYVTDVLFKAIETGQMTAEEFISTIGVFASSAAALDIPISTVAATMATLTKGGMNAAMASTSLNAIFKQLMTPGDELAKVIKRLGYETGQAMVEQEGLANSLMLIRQHAGSDSAFAELLGELEAIRGSLLLTGTQYEDFIATDQAFANSAAVTGTVANNFDKQMQSLSAQTQLMSNAFREFRLEVAELVVPLVRAGVALITGLLNGINKMPEPIRKIIAGFSILVPALGVFAAYAATSAIRVMLMTRALNMLAASRIVGLIPGLRTLILQFTAMGGLSGAVRTFFATLVRGSTAARAALLRSAASMAVTMAGYMALAAVVYQVTFGLRNLKNQAEQTARSLSAIDTPEDSFEKIRQRIQLLNNELENTNHIAQVAEGGLGGQMWWSLRAALQQVASILPNIDPTMAEDLFERIATQEQIALLTNYGIGLESITARINDLGNIEINRDEVLGFFQELERMGVVSAEQVANAWGAYDKVIMTLTADQYELMRALDAGELVVGSDDYQKAIEAQETLSAAYDYYDSVISAIVPEVERLAIEQGLLNEVQQAAEDRAMRAGVASGDLSNAIFTVGDVAAGAKDKLSALVDVLNVLLGTQLNVAQSEAKLGSAFRSFADLVADGNFSLQAFTERGELTVNALSGLNQAIIDVAKSTYYQNEDINEAVAVMLGYTEAVVLAAREAGLAEGDIAAMVEMMGLTPEHLLTILELDGVDEAIHNIDTVAAYMASFDGLVATSTVDVQFKVAGNDLGFTSRAINDVVRESIGSLVNRIPKRAGGGSSRDQFTLTEEQKRLIAEALARPIINNFTGDAFYAQIAEEADAVHQSAVEHAFMAIPSRVSASILQAAGESGQDPAREIEELAELYIRAAELVGESEAMLAAQFYDSLEGFRNWVSEIEQIQQMHKAKEDYLFSTGGIDNTEYLAILQERLQGLEEYSSDWISIMDQIESIEEEQQASQQNRQNNRFASGDMAEAEYLEILNQRLDGLEQYSDEWMRIMGEIQSIQDNAEAEAFRVAQSMYELEDTSTEDYLSFLNERLEGLEKYSVEYMEILRMINNAQEIAYQEERRVEGARYDLGEVSREDYLAGLEEVLEGLEMYSAEYMAIWNEIQGINEEIAAEQDEAAREAERRASAEYELGDTSRDEYLAQLEDRLEGLERYSDEYMAVWREIEAINDEVTREQEQAADEQQRILDDQARSLTNWRDNIVDAFERISDSVTDPIYRATDLVGAFGDQADVSLDQIRGFYENIEQGTSRWIDTIRGLQEQGVDQEFLQQLISEGPQSLGFAESILGMGADAIDLINTSMAGIRDLTDDFGQEFAGGQVGTVVQSQNNFTIDIGGISIAVGEDSGLTADQVQNAVTEALLEVTNQLAAGNSG